MDLEKRRAKQSCIDSARELRTLFKEDKESIQKAVTGKICDTYLEGVDKAEKKLDHLINGLYAVSDD